METQNDRKDRMIVAAVLVGIILLPGLALCQRIVMNDEPAQKVRELTQVERRMRKVISVDYRGTPIEDVLRGMAKQADIDIVKSPEVIGEVTATLTDVPLDEALKSILSAHGYAYLPSENIIMVVPKSQLLAEKQKLVNRVYRVTYANVEDVYKALRSYVSDEGEIAYNLGTSNLMITDTESKIEAIDDFITEVDRETPQILIEAKIYDVQTSDGVDFGFNWNIGKLTEFPGGVTNPGPNPVGETDPFITGVLDGMTNAAGDVDGLIRWGFLNNNVDIDVLFAAQEKVTSARLLANPKILTLDNEEAHIEIIREIPYQELTQTSAGGQIGTTDFRDVGVFLTVTPHVTRDDKVRMHIVPEFSVETGKIPVGADLVANAQPIVASRKADTHTLVDNGTTVVIGGLKQTSVQQTIDKIPFLGDLPILGFLFKFEGDETIFQELMIFITPRIVSNPKLTPRQQQHYDDTNFEMPPLEPTMYEKLSDLKDKVIPKERADETFGAPMYPDSPETSAFLEE
jgi:type IV pilus assembly protein PilQ